MLERIHAGRVTEFRRVLRTCAIAVSAGRHALFLKVPHGEDPDGFARAFHRHCREKAGRPVRFLDLHKGDRHPVRRLADLLGIDPGTDVRDLPLADLLGARDRTFERLRGGLASDLATDGGSSGPGLLVIEGDPREFPTLAAFLAFLCPGSSPWRSLPSVRPRNEQFAVVAVVAEEAPGAPASALPDGIETLSIRPLAADDLRAAADAAHELLFNGFARGRPAAKAPASCRDTDVPPAEAVDRLLADGAAIEALDRLEASGMHPAPEALARVRILAGRPTQALEGLSETAAAGRLPARTLLESGRLAVVLGRIDRADTFLDALEHPRGRPGPFAQALPDLLRAEMALARGEAVTARDLLGSIEARDPDVVAARDNLLGAARFRTGQHAAAREAFDAVLANAGAPRREKARARHNLGLVALREGRLDAAAALLQEAVVEADDLGESYGGALARRNLAIALEHSGRYSPALELAVEAADRLSRQDRPADLAAAFLTLADLMLTFGEWDRALSLVSDAQQNAPASAIVAARCAFKRSECLLLRDRPAEALEGLHDAIAQLDRLQLADLAAFARVRAAEACLGAGDASRADAFARRVLQRETSLQDEAAGRAMRVLGRLSLLADQPARALADLDPARRVLASLAQREPLALALADLAEATSRLGDDAAAAVLADEARTQIEDLAESIPPAHRAAFRARPGISRLLDLPGVAPAPQAVADTGRDAPAPVLSLGVRPRLRHRVPKIVGDSPALDRVLVAIERVRDVPVPILLYGESGTGKELFAEALHQLSSRGSGPFVRVNAAAFPDTLLLTELFGHEKGAFTGAHARRIGRFESAHGGTLFLDEIGDVSEQAQAALLRVIEEQRFTRVGGSETVSVDVRLVFATNRDLDERMRAGRMRRDFYHRIAGLTIPVPPLRERAGDIPALVEAFLVDLSREGGRPLSIAPDAMEVLRQHRWPGNIRELRNVVRRAILLSGGPLLSLDALLREAPELARAGRRVGGSLDVYDLVFGRGVPLFDARREVEVALIREALNRSGGNISAAATLLGMKRPRLSQMVKEYDLKVPVAARAREG